MTELVLSDFSRALADLGPADLATAYLSPGSLPTEPRRVLLDLPATLSSAPSASALAEWLVERRDRVRHVEGLHAKVALGDAAALLGSANFTEGGLRRNVEAGVVLRDPARLAELREWYERLWSHGKTFDPATLLATAETIRPATRAAPPATYLLDVAPPEPMRDDLLDHLYTFGSPEAADVYLDLVARIVRTLDFGPDQGPISVTLPRDGLGPRVNVGATWVLLPSQLDGEIAVLLLLPEGVEPTDGVPYAPCASGAWWNFPLTADLLDRHPEWEAAARSAKRHGPLQKRHHREDALRVALDSAFRAAALAAAFAEEPPEESGADFWDRFDAYPRPLGDAPAIVYHWGAESLDAWRTGEIGSVGSREDRLLSVRPQGDVWIVTYAGNERWYVGGHLVAERGGEPDPGWFAIRGPIRRFASGDDAEFLTEQLDLKPYRRPSDRSQALVTVRSLSEDQAHAFRARFAER